MQYLCFHVYILMNGAQVLFFFFKAFEEAGIDDWKDRLVGFGSDGAAVNVGCRNGVAAQLLRDIPYLISIHCVVHRLEMGVTKAIKENTNMVQLQNTLKNLYDQEPQTITSCCWKSETSHWVSQEPAPCNLRTLHV